MFEIHLNIREAIITYFSIFERNEKTDHLWENRVYLESIICPRTKLHHAALFIKWKIFYIDSAWWFIDCRRLPKNLPVVFECSFGHQSHLIVAVRAATKQSNVHIFEKGGYRIFRMNLLVVEDNIREPDMFRGYIKHFNASIFLRIPT